MNRFILADAECYLRLSCVMYIPYVMSSYQYEGILVIYTVTVRILVGRFQHKSVVLALILIFIKALTS